MQKHGKFITFEGCEGAGKSTQVQMLSGYLTSQGIESIVTREVGGTDSAEQIRECWLSKKDGFWEPVTEVLLITAARNEHLKKKILPALREGKWVICDRFLDSTIAYQGLGLGVDIGLIQKLYELIAEGIKPDITILLDIKANSGLDRVESRNGIDDRYQQKNIEFHETLRKAYLAIANENKKRFAIVDASEDKETIAAKIAKIVDERLLNGE
ncbi:MAG: dTMP kinase [Alphaproteobacteria bacterium]|nr:dTMP kinase [Alphaproteobacteria bacterium]MCL2505554.1 dTMP kinase [Alphaproteobacteria bacterium]